MKVSLSLPVLVNTIISKKSFRKLWLHIFLKIWRSWPTLRMFLNLWQLY